MGFSFFKSKDRGRQKIDPEIAAALKGERSSNPQVSIKLAEHFMRENKRELAVDEYMHAAQAFMDKRQTQLAMAVYRNILTIDPERYSVYETLADLYLKSGFPGDGASVLLALAYQYKTAGCASEVKRVLDSVLEYAPDNPVLKRKVQAFLTSEGMTDNAAEKPAASTLPDSSFVRPVSPARSREPASEPEVVIGPVVPAKESAAPEPISAPVQPCASDPGLEISAQPDAAAHPDEPEAPAQNFFDLKEALAPDGPPEPEGAPARPDEPDSEPHMFVQVDAPVQSDEPQTLARPLVDVQSALEMDAAPEQPWASDPEPEFSAQPDAAAHPDEPEAPARHLVDVQTAFETVSEPEHEDVSVEPGEPDETARSFFDLQAALAMDGSLELDHDSSSESLLNVEQGRAPFSVLDVVKDIAEQDTGQDTPLFHFNLGVAYMQCADYEQAVDEFLSALYGTSDKIECYVRLAECSLKLHRRELARGFLREALDLQALSPDQERDIRNRLAEISAD